MATRVTRNIAVSPPKTVNLRCPACGHLGAFQGSKEVADLAWTGLKSESVPPKVYTAGLRLCPNDDCRALVFVVLRQGALQKSFPSEVIDFDSTNLPEPILRTLEEAIKAHAAECNRAAALMVRRVLEELCDDKKVQGPDLKARLAALGGSVIVPKELLDAADQLRILGNDAAHVEAKAYDNIGPDEAAVAIELAKELLKAVYQYTALVDKLKAMGKPPPATTGP